MGKWKSLPHSNLLWCFSSLTVCGYCSHIRNVCLVTVHEFTYYTGPTVQRGLVKQVDVGILEDLVQYGCIYMSIVHN